MGKPSIFLTRAWPAEVTARLTRDYAVTVNEPDEQMDEAALIAAMASHDALCPTVTDPVTARVIDAAGRSVRMIGNYGVGVNHIDLAAANAAGIPVSNTPGVLTDATADLALTLILMTARRAGEGERELRSGTWSGWRPTHLVGQELRGKTLGVIGFGRIAQATAERAKAAFGMKIVYYNRSAKPELEASLGAERLDLQGLLATSDFVSLHCPSTPETIHLIDAAALSAMKPTAILINTARGNVVDEAALATALAERRIAGAGLDVYEEEPRVLPALLACENAVLLPHLGSATRETRIAMGMKVADNLDRFFAGEPLIDPVA